MATTAAPVYFPLSKNVRGVFADGGLVANAPGLFGLHEVNHFIAPNTTTTVRVLSIGTMTIGATIRGNANLDRGFGRWRGSLFDLVISAQEGAVDSMLRQLLGSHYYRIDDEATPDQSKDIKALDRASAAATQTLRTRGLHAAQRALGDPAFKPFRNHRADVPEFFHGPNKSTGGN